MIVSLSTVLTYWEAVMEAVKGDGSRCTLLRYNG